MDLHEIADSLYAVAPKDFTSARDRTAREVKADGDRPLSQQVSTLRRPTTAAWAVNLLVRRHRDEVERLVQLGDQLRGAQRSLAGDALRDLNRQQHTLLGGVRQQAEAAAAAAGRPLSDTMGRQVESALRAAMSDPAAAAAVRSGLLTAPLQSTGLGSVDVGGAVAIPPSPRDTPGPAAAGGGGREGQRRASRRPDSGWRTRRPRPTRPPTRCPPRGSAPTPPPGAARSSPKRSTTSDGVCHGCRTSCRPSGRPNDRSAGSARTPTGAPAPRSAA